MSSNIATEQTEFIEQLRRVHGYMSGVMEYDHGLMGGTLNGRTPHDVMTELLGLNNKRAAPSVSVETKTEDSVEQEAVAEPVKSTGQIDRVLQRSETDCVRCCIAMLTGLTYEDVPDFVRGQWADWAKGLQRWLARRGKGLLMSHSKFDFVPPWLPIMAIFDATEDTPGHCVVLMKDAVIDPHEPPKQLTTLNGVYAILSMTGGCSHAVGASSETSAPLIEPAGEFKMSILTNLLNAAQRAATELQKRRIRSREYELGIRLQLAIERAAK